jgi:hypothetical protein
MRSVRYRGAGGFGFRDDLVHLGSGGDGVPDAELTRLGGGEGDAGVLGEFGARVRRQDEPAAERERRNGSGGASYIAFELGSDQAF